MHLGLTDFCPCDVFKLAPQALKWDDRLADACGCEGIVLRDDESDGTAQAGTSKG